MTLLMLNLRLAMTFAVLTLAAHINAAPSPLPEPEEDLRKIETPTILYRGQRDEKGVRGQRRDVIVTRLVAADTIEEKIDAVLKEKEELFDRFVDEGVESGQGRLSESDYFQLVGLEQALAPAATA